MLVPAVRAFKHFRMHNAAHPELIFFFLFKFHLSKSKKEEVERKGGPLFNRYSIYNLCGKIPKL